MDFSYDTGDDAILDVRAYYARDGALLGVAAHAPVLDDRRAHTSWGYDATWTKQLDRASRLAVGVGFVDASLDVATGLVESRLASPRGPADTTTLNNRAAEAEGRYESLAAEGHAIRVAARAQLLDLAIPLVRGERETLFLGIPGAAGLSVRVDVDDTWTLAPRVSLDYGLGVVQAVDGAASTLLVPRVGARWGTGRWHVAGVASYHDVAASPEPNVSIAQVGLLQPAEPWGYKGEIVYFQPVGGLSPGTRIQTNNLPNGGAVTRNVTDYFVNSLYSGAVIDHNDIAVLRMDTAAPDWALSYGLYTDTNLTGADFTVAGYGRLGDGATGANNFTARLRQGTTCGCTFPVSANRCASPACSR